MYVSEQIKYPGSLQHTDTLQNNITQWLMYDIWKSEVHV